MHWPIALYIVQRDVCNGLHWTNWILHEYWILNIEQTEYIQTSNIALYLVQGDVMDCIEQTESNSSAVENRKVESNESYPWISSISCGCSSSSLIFSILLDMEFTAWSATVILECRSLIMERVLSITWALRSFANWCLSWSHLRSYSFLMNSLA